MISGVVADAWDRRRLMLMTQTGSAVVAIGLALLAFSGSTSVWPVYALAALGSAVGAFDLPARQSLVPSLVPREDLPNAISLNTIMQQTAQVLGPALGGIVIASTNVGWAYVINAISFVAVIVGAADDARRANATEKSTSKDDISWRAAREGLRFVFRSPLIRSTMLLDFFATFFSSATALLPIFAQDILQVGADGIRLAVCRARGRCDADERGDGAADEPHRTPRSGAACGPWRSTERRPSASACRVRSGSRSRASP